MDYRKSFDEFLNDILADYRSQKPDADTAAATLIFIKSACFASALWGLNNQINETGKKPFPDKCNLDDLKHWAQIKGILNIDAYIESNGTFTALASEVLSRMQNPGGGGNKTDWERWAGECSYDHGTYVEMVFKTRPWEDKRYTGSVDIVITSNRTNAQGGEQEPTDELIQTVSDYIESRRSLGIAKDFLVHGATKVLQGVSMSLSDGDVQVSDALIDAIEGDIIEYMKGIIPGGTLYRAQLEAIANNRGVNIESILPDENITVLSGPDVYERIWPDVDNISIVEA